jgi:HK97 gp10 family phage protein
MKIRVKVEGLSSLKDAFEELPKATGKNIMKRILKDRAVPLAAYAESLAPVRTGKLRMSISIGTKLSRRQAALARDSKSYTEVYIGPSPLAQATAQEFGTNRHAAQPFMRPAWDAFKDRLLEMLASDLWLEIKKAADRIAKKAAKAE